jgi:hypothetical protein
VTGLAAGVAPELGEAAVTERAAGPAPELIEEGTR